MMRKKLSYLKHWHANNLCAWITSQVLHVGGFVFDKINLNLMKIS